VKLADFTQKAKEVVETDSLDLYVIIDKNETAIY